MLGGADYAACVDLRMDDFSDIRAGWNFANVGTYFLRKNHSAVGIIRGHFLGNFGAKNSWATGIFSATNEITCIVQYF